MWKAFIHSYSERYLPRWIVLLFDTFSAFLVFYLAYALRTNFDFSFLNNSLVHAQALLLSMVFGVSFLLCGTHKGVIRFTNQYDTFRLFRTVALTSFGLIIITMAYGLQASSPGLLGFPISVLIIHALLVFGILLASRIVIREIYENYLKTLKSKDSVRTLIYGAGKAGIVSRQTVEREPKSKNVVLGFIDDNVDKVGKFLEGVPILHPSEALTHSYILKNRIKEVIISIQELSKERRNQIVDKCLSLNVRVKQIPSVRKWINGELSYSQIRQINIEDLLERDPIKLDSSNVTAYIKDKTVLVTGAAGSIGSEIARQILHFEPKMVVLLDQAETPLFEIEQELVSKFPSLEGKTKFVLANIKDLFRMEQIFEKERPDIVFHAAAYKHVPLMEENPYEAVFVNVFGTKTLADLAVEYDVEKFVMISTDKAVNPTNVMGASKRVAEIYIQSLNTNQSSTQFITTRFGNVLGSNGSVIPIFKRQIEQGGPITLTHKEVKRYFMTIPEACNLVLEAGAIGNGGEIFLFDMGEPVRIYDLACKMIKLSGLELDSDISIKIIGLRPGEKLFEELFTDKENLLSTHHPKILKAAIDHKEYHVVRDFIKDLSSILIEKSDADIVRMLKQIVPEYRSQNSQYQLLDKATQH